MSEEDDDERTHRPTGRLSRLARLSSMTASVAARSLTQRVVGVFQDEETSEESAKKARTKNAELIAGTFGELKGAAMKVGQMLSADPELLPDEFKDALATLHSEAPPMDFDMVRGVIEDALGGQLEDHFSAFGEEPIGAASIGQVHRATTHDGTDVAVKVQYPGIADTLDSDLKNLKSLMNLGRVHIDRDRLETYFHEVREVILREGDYLNEADNLERFQLVWRDLPGVRAPIPVHELTRKTVLTMEFIEGERLWNFLDESDSDTATDVAQRVVTAYISMVHEHRLLHADPHPGNFLVDTEGAVVFLDLGAVRDYDAAFSEGLLTIIEGMWEVDLEKVQETWQELGFVDEKIDPDTVYEWLEMILQPLLEDVEFDFGGWKIHEMALKFTKDNPSIMTFAPPKEAVFYLRVLAGLRGLLGRTNVKLNAHQIARAAHARLRG
jgi:predicted unusual protein kinase regulating ubiquinone biosynthesis (AarF/ABC1/UbiB family)